MSEVFVLLSTAVLPILAAVLVIYLVVRDAVRTAEEVEVGESVRVRLVIELEQPNQRSR